jgi:hypothetical protein
LRKTKKYKAKGGSKLMVDYMKKHEKYVVEALEKDEDIDWAWLKDYHKTQIEYIQHERLIHLLVTLTFGLLFVITIMFAVCFEKIVILPVSLLLLVLLVPYIGHYFKLENGVQRWYGLYNKLDENSRRKA